MQSVRVGRLILCLVLFLGIGIGLVFGISESPDRNAVVIWEPFKYECGSAAGDKVVLRTVTQDQGYGPVYRYEDDCSTDNSVGSCYRFSWDIVPAATGIIMIQTHGNVGCILGVGVGTDNEDSSVATAWKEGGADNSNMIVWYWNRKAHTSLHVVYVLSPWFSSNWHDDVEDHRTIVFLDSCHGDNAGGGTSVSDAIGGRMRWAYAGISNTADHASDIDTMLGRMNGLLPPGAQGTARRSGAAWALGGFSDNAVLDAGTSWADTTLCPAVTNWSPKTEGGASGTGFVEFDTRCDKDGHAATSALADTVIYGNISVTGKVWTNDHKLSFNYAVDNCCDYDYKVYISAVADHVMSKKYGYQELDGNLFPDKKNGVAPHEDNFEWYFTGKYSDD